MFFMAVKHSLHMKKIDCKHVKKEPKADIWTQRKENRSREVKITELGVSPCTT
jgi:hypothetical protein